MKSKIYLFLTILIAVITVFVYSIYYSPGAKKSLKNVNNSQKLKVGMSLDEALKIMGDPDDVRQHFHDRHLKIFYYEPPFGASDGIEFHVDTTDRIIAVIPYEPT